MGFIDDIKKEVLIFDGSKGFMLQQAGLPAGGSPEEFNLSHKDTVYDLHKKYIDAGCNVIQTNTFTGNRIMLEKHGLEDKTYDVNRAGAELAKKAAGNKAYVAASIGPTGDLFEPFGTLTFEKAYEVFCEQVKAVADGGADIINFETFTDVAEMKVALLASKENCSLPVICSMAFEENKRTLMGTDPAACARILKSAGADMVGTNCSFGPEHMTEIVREMATTGEYLSVKPNAGLPRIEDGETVYEQCPTEFAEDVSEYFDLNVRLIGGCCGTSPEFIQEIKNKRTLNEYKGEIDKRAYLCSLMNSIPVEDIKIISTININDKMDDGDITDEIYEAVYDECDVIEISYEGKNPDLLKNILVLNMTAIKKPVILSGDNPDAISNALRIYPGIAGIRNETPASYGAVLMS